ncbi:MAG: hypothetical protein GQ551_11715 [Myxococcales bacterium]|nr:hypothetical protein [Myxococcales bacterium]
MSDGDDKKSRTDGRKERVLHTRVPAVLEQELKRVANAWRVPVSNVVRALLEDALDTLEHLSGSSDAPGPAEEPAPVVAPLDGAVGVTPITLVHDTVCGVTGEKLPAGSEAYMVLFDDPGRKLITGRDALPQASTPKQEKADD